MRAIVSICLSKERSMVMGHYTREDILNLVEEEGIAYIRLQFTDVFGTLKNIAVTR